MQNTVLTFIAENIESATFKNIAGGKLTCTIATPRFKASRHLIFTILSAESGVPVMIAKVPRIQGDNSQLELEVEKLNKVQGLSPDGLDSVPKVLAYTEIKGHRLLLETVVMGQTMRPTMVRRKRVFCMEKGFDWLVGLHQLSRMTDGDESTRIRRTLDSVLLLMDDLARFSEQDIPLIDRTRELAAGLAVCDLPTVFEHGDFSSPNILVSDSGQLGVVDWELAQERGLPALDLFFFLNYIGYASERQATVNADHLRTFRKTFFSESTWTTDLIKRYWQALELPIQASDALFVLCWARYVASLVARLSKNQNGRRDLSKQDQDWLRSNRYYQMWRYSIEHFDELTLLTWL